MGYIHTDAPVNPGIEASDAFAVRYLTYLDVTVFIWDTRAVADAEIRTRFRAYGCGGGFPLLFPAESLELLDGGMTSTRLLSVILASPVLLFWSAIIHLPG
jgi:hypothetical protein